MSDDIITDEDAPEWLKGARRIWKEDKATWNAHGHETIGAAWKRLFGEEIPKVGSRTGVGIDYADRTFFLHKKGIEGGSFEGRSIWLSIDQRIAPLVGKHVRHVETGIVGSLEKLFGTYEHPTATCRVARLSTGDELTIKTGDELVEMTDVEGAFFGDTVRLLTKMLGALSKVMRETPGLMQLPEGRRPALFRSAFRAAFRRSDIR